MEELKKAVDLLKPLSEAAAAGLTWRTGKLESLAFPLNSLEESVPMEDPIKKSFNELKDLASTGKLDYGKPVKKPDTASSQDDLVRDSIEELKRLLVSKSEMTPTPFIIIKHIRGRSRCC